MANLKISALTSATTPLAGTEVLPIVQSGTTVKVANNDLRPKQIQSNATSGVLQVVGPAAAATRVMTTPDANFTAARTDAAQTFTGVQTFLSNVIVNDNGFIRSNTLATGWTFDTTSTAVTITNGNLITFSGFSGMFLLTETAVYGTTALYITGSGAIVLISQSSGVNYTTTSGAGNIRFYWNSGASGYTLQNNSGSTLTFNICSFKNRTSN
jgi:hypothetical protein